MTANIPKPSWRKPEPPKSFWKKVLTSIFGGLGFFSVVPIPGLQTVIPRPVSYFVRVTEKKTAEKTDTTIELPKATAQESVKAEVARQIAIGSESADMGKNIVSYKVQAGDSLWKIAQNQYGDGMRWIDIYIANQLTIKEPNFIFSGQELKIPKFVLSRTALFKSPAQAVAEPKITLAGLSAQAGEMIKKQIISAADSIAQLSINTAALAAGGVGASGDSGTTLNQVIVSQLNSNANEARQLANQANNISDFNSNSVDLAARALNLGRETIALSQIAKTAQAATPDVSAAATMAWSQDAAGNIKYYTKKDGAWTPNEVNPLGNIGAVYGTQDITQTPEYKSGKIIKIAPQFTPSKQTILSQSPIAIAANTAVAKMDNSVLGNTTGAALTTEGVKLPSSDMAINAITAVQTLADAKKTIMASQASPAVSKAILDTVAADLIAHMIERNVPVVGGEASQSAASQSKSVAQSQAESMVGAMMQGAINQSLDESNPGIAYAGAYAAEALSLNENTAVAVARASIEGGIPAAVETLGTTLGVEAVAEYGLNAAELSSNAVQATNAALSSIASGVSFSAPEPGHPDTPEQAVADARASVLGGYKEAAKESAITATTMASVAQAMAGYVNTHQSSIDPALAVQLNAAAQKATEDATQAQAAVTAATLSTVNPEAEAMQGVAKAMESQTQQMAIDLSETPPTPEEAEVSLESNVAAAAAARSAQAEQMSQEMNTAEVAVVGHPGIAPDETSPVAGIESEALSARETAEQVDEGPAAATQAQAELSAAAPAAAKSAEAPAISAKDQGGLGTDVNNPGVSVGAPGITAGPEGGISMSGGGYKSGPGINVSTPEGKISGIGLDVNPTPETTPEETNPEQSEGQQDQGQGEGQAGGSEGSADSGPGTGGTGGGYD